MIELTSTQYPGAKSQSTDIVVGIDFGTSCTKVVFQSPYAFERRAVLIDFGKFGYPESSHLLPSQIGVNANGYFTLDPDRTVTVHNDLKVPLLSESLSKDGTISPDHRYERIIFATAFLANVLQLSRTIFLSENEDIYKSYNLKWQFNLGIPSKGYDDLQEKNVFRLVAENAWLVSVAKEEFDFDSVDNILRSRKNKQLTEDIHFKQINVIPEIAAEVVGYAKSDSRSLGLHVMIDIGASTLDITGFNLEDDSGSLRNHILTTDLKWLGAYMCHMARVNALKEAIYEHLDRIANDNDAMAVTPSSLNNYVESINKLQISDEKKINPDFMKQCRSCIHRLIKVLKDSRYPSSDAWKSGLPIFVCGGGKNLDIYQTVLDELHDTWTTQILTQGFSFKKLPIPKNLKSKLTDQEDYDRYAVAYGLSFPEYDIGEIVPPYEITDLDGHPKSSKYDDCEYVSKDMV